MQSSVSRFFCIFKGNIAKNDAKPSKSVGKANKYFVDPLASSAEVMILKALHYIRTKFFPPQYGVYGYQKAQFLMQIPKIYGKRTSVTKAL
jgi:hypothetical protein